MVQFHPESIASEYGKTLFKNFLELCEKKILKMLITDILFKLNNNKNLTAKKQILYFFLKIISGKLSEIQSAGFLMALATKGLQC